jgi:glucose-6-phosphate isomerase
MKSLLNIDIGNLFSEKEPEHFITSIEANSFFEKFGACFNEMLESLHKHQSPLTLSLPAENTLRPIKYIAESIRQKYENILIIGIGGSTLGFRSIVQMLKGPFYNYLAASYKLPRVFVLDNIDPVPAKQVEELLDLKKTVIIYISKSGSTPEPAANFVHFYNKYLCSGGSKEDIIIICDPGNNSINKIADDLGCHKIHIPHDLSGRYSVLSAVGFLPSELIGIDSSELLHGAIEMNNSILNKPMKENAVFLLGACLSELEAKRKNIHVLFNYSSILSEFGLWFVQLWAESLGKNKSLGGKINQRGITPLSALGATDQHSLLQLFKEGPNDKIYGFVTIDKLPKEIQMTNEFPARMEYEYFGGHTMGEQLRIEQISTEMSLVKSKCPCYRIIIPEITAYHVGGLFYFFEALVVFIAKLWDINAFNQPGVEEGKNMTYSLMGRKDLLSARSGYELELASVRERKYLLDL